MLRGHSPPVPDVTLGEPRSLEYLDNERLRHATPSGTGGSRLPSQTVAAQPTRRASSRNEYVTHAQIYARNGMLIHAPLAVVGDRRGTFLSSR
jgi:hypothetical protein